MLKDIKLNELLIPSDELIKAVKDYCNPFYEVLDIEDLEYLVFNDNKYCFRAIKDEDWSTEDGKHESKQIIGQLICAEIEEKYNLFVTQTLTRTGSYFSNYMNEPPELFILEEEYVEEIIIPAHTKNVLKSVDN